MDRVGAKNFSPLQEGKMANKEQLAILKQGVEAWNKWREGNPDAKIDLSGVDLRETQLVRVNLSSADITGAKLWGTSRDNWIIDGIRCKYVYWDEAGEVRTPPDYNFRPGEFEELYKQLPSFEYVFAQSFTPLHPLIMDRVVQVINEQHKDFSLELVNFDKRGKPHATFTVCHLDYVDAARENVTAIYEKTIAYLMQENEYVFAQGATQLAELIMDRVVQAINEQHKEFLLEPVNFDKRGEQKAIFTVCRSDYMDAARGNVTEIYEKTIELGVTQLHKG